MVARIASVTLALVALLVLAFQTSDAQTGLRGRVSYVNATNATVTQFGGSVFVSNMTGDHVITVGNASSYKPGDRLRVIETGGKLASTGNLTISSVSNINGGANYTMNNVTYQGVELEVIGVGPDSTSGTAYVAHALAKACYAP